jgi:MoaA/NifB/PqqE/SkfB family radical SAM enzyme
MAQQYVDKVRMNDLPRLPLEGSIDLTYRCNDNCRHCWSRISPNAKEKQEELTFEDIKKIVDEAKTMGCRRWSISGGEPMLRPDFSQIFEYITSSSISYSINTNGTLITPKIAQLMRRKGTKMVALYGATAEVHDHITRNPGSFEATMRGFAFLREAGAGFIVQVIPMKDNYHQFKDMVELAESLSLHYRIGATWLYPSASGDPERNSEIMAQRLPAKEVVELDKPDLAYEEWRENEDFSCPNAHEDGYLFASCINSRRSFHIDPYGQMTFCYFIKEGALRYDLRKGSFKECWETFIPSLAHRIKVTQEYLENCGPCEFRKDCYWCPVYGYLEHRRFDAKVSYLCAVARKNKGLKDDWKKTHRRYFKIADITIQVESDLPITETTFHPNFRHFEVDGPGLDTIAIRHHFFLPDFNANDLGKELYRKPPWAVYKKGDSWIYLGISPAQGDESLDRVAVFNSDHTRVRIYNEKEETFLKGNLRSLSMFPTDQILIARVLADRQGCYIHSCGVNYGGNGLLFAGHSEAGKSTMATMIKGKAEILCDDRIIVRGAADGFKIYGTWSHGEVPDVSANSAALKAIIFLQKADENRLTLLQDKQEITKRLLSCLIRPFVTADWWDKTLVFIEKLSAHVDSYVLEFDKTGEVINELRKL